MPPMRRKTRRRRCRQQKPQRIGRAKLRLWRILQGRAWRQLTSRRRRPRWRRRARRQCATTRARPKRASGRRPPRRRQPAQAQAMRRNRPELTRQAHLQPGRRSLQVSAFAFTGCRRGLSSTAPTAASPPSTLSAAGTRSSSRGRTGMSKRVGVSGSGQARRAQRGGHSAAWCTLTRLLFRVHQLALACRRVYTLRAAATP